MDWINKRFFIFSNFHNKISNLARFTSHIGWYQWERQEKVSFGFRGVASTTYCISVSVELQSLCLLHKTVIISPYKKNCSQQRKRPLSSWRTTPIKTDNELKSPIKFNVTQCFTNKSNSNMFDDLRYAWHHIAL